ncbi:MAG: hypothetical protein LBQ14_06785 [Treponema sp.]|nr:hypothetical protein [Treponema sp.]
MLQKALAKEAAPDVMGQALKDRILRLARTKSSPYTALSILKAYASFQAGLCVSLKEGVYHDYASVGLGITKSAIPQKALEHGEKGLFKAGSAADLSLNSPKGDLIFWAFPLDKREPCGAMLLLGGDGSFDPAVLEPIVYDVREVFSLPGKSETPEIEMEAASRGEPETAPELELETVPGGEPESVPEMEPESAPGKEPETAPEVELESTLEGEPKPETAPETGLSAAGQGIIEELAKFHTKNVLFQGIILDSPDQGGDFCAEIAQSIVSFGTALSLPSRRCLALFPQNIDRELAAHRLAKEFQTACVFSFEADTPGRALELTQPYWQDGGTGS